MKLVNKFILQTIKNFKSMVTKIKVIWLFCILCFIMYSCGSVVKATVQNPQNTAKTTITISTNTPIETQVDPNTNANIDFERSK